MFVIIGGGGYLGNYLIKNIRERGNDKIISTYHSEISKNSELNENIEWVHFDMTDQTSIGDLYEKVLAYKKEDEKVVCIYTAGYIKPDDCELNPVTAINVNIPPLANILAIFNNIFDVFIFTSTDFVYGESISEHKFAESDLPKPETVYGAIKYACERIVLSHGYTVVRLPFMFGPSLNKNRKHFFEHIYNTIFEKKVFDVLCDYYESSLDYNTVAHLIIELIYKFNNKIPLDVINIAADEKISKYDIARNYINNNELFYEYIKPLKLNDTNFFVAKRCSIMMDNSSIKDLLAIDSICIDYRRPENEQ